MTLNPLLLVTFFPAYWRPYCPAAQTSLEKCPALDGAVNIPGHLWFVHLDAHPVQCCQR